MTAKFVCQSPAYADGSGVQLPLYQRVRFLVPHPEAGVEVGCEGRVVFVDVADDITHFICVTRHDCVVVLEDYELWHIEVV